MTNDLVNPDTPFHIGVGPTPNEVTITTPGTPPLGEPVPRSKFESLLIDSEQSSPQLAIEQNAETVDIHPVALELGITGADLSLPLFDGTSTDPADYLIKFDDDSMEKYPDVRAYFWMVGFTAREMKGIDASPPHDREVRVPYDQELVTEGREILRDMKARGHG
jgi:hypothetical protein